jgi:hypothetical protein
VYQTTTTISPQLSASSPSLDVSFNLLKNQINTIGTYFNKKHDISISDNPQAHITPTPRQPLRIPISPSTQPAQLQQSPPQYTNPAINNTTTGTSGFSTPITALRENPPPSRNTQVSHIPQPIITSSDMSFENNDFNDGLAESVAGSDVGSIMDLDDFEKSL